MGTTVTIYNLSVEIQTDNTNFSHAISDFIYKFYTSKNSGFNNKNKVTDYKMYFSKLKHYNVFYLHTRQFIHLWNYIKINNISIPEIIKVDKREYNIEKVDYKIKENWKLREDQQPVFDFIVSNAKESILVPLPTGSGKTVISLISLAALKNKIGIIILPIYIDKWVNDIINIHKATMDDIMVVQGSKSLKALIELAKNNELVSKYIIFSSRTLQEFITNYEEFSEEVIEEYGIKPIDLFPLLGIGSLLIDEQHQHFHAVFRILLHCNVKFHLALTATLMSDDYVVRKMHNIVFKKENIYSNIKLNKYIDVYAVKYTIKHEYLKLIKTTNYGSSNYSHIAFEQSIIKRDFLLDKYVKIILNAIDDYYISDYKENDKLLIFVSTVNFATLLAEKIKEHIPELVTNRYCQEDPYENLISGNIIVSTIISAGTGIDIANLRVVIQTVSISSQVANIQSLGRLRKLSDKDVKFIYLYSDNIGKQKEYHLKRIELFKDRTASINYRASRVNLI